ncbi:hypothetical protein ABZ570_15315 [Micromonospora sp. NPDC007271]|uniref:hypothetical protein n=1 Tax=Micromonospora sp. NPDC007271 TaxID=3154587 RepID=UPI0033F3B64C
MGLLILGGFVLLLAGATYVIGEQVAGRTCIERGVELLVPEQRVAETPEGYSVGIPREGVCRVDYRVGLYTEVSLNRWDWAEGALVLASIAGLTDLVSIALWWRRPRGESRSLNDEPS